MAKNLSIIVDTCYIICTLIFMIVAIIALVKVSNSDYKYMSKMGFNWNSGPIISLNTDGSACQNLESNFIQDKWPGTTDGCFCSFSLDFLGPLRKGACYSNRDNLLFCNTVAERPAIQFSKWRGRSLCGERLQASYLDLTTAENEKSCPTNLKPCGIIDSLKNVLCLPKSTECPLNEIKFIPEKEQIPTDKNYSILKTLGGSILVSNENIRGKILNEFVLSDLQPCADPGYTNSVSKDYLLNPFYEKTKCQEKVGEIQFDDRYYSIDTNNYNTILNENNITPLITSLPNYPAIDNHSVNLYARNFIGINPKCLKTIKDEGNTNTLLKDLNEVEQKLGSTMGLAVASMIIAIIIFIFGIVYAVMCICNWEDSVIKIFISIVPIMLAIVTTILCALTAANLVNYSNDGSVLTQRDCVDDITYEAATNFDSSIKSTRSLSIFGTVLSVCIITMPIISLIFNACL